MVDAQVRLSRLSKYWYYSVVCDHHTHCEATDNDITVKLVNHPTLIPNKLNHRLQASYARVCKENKEKNDCQLKYLRLKDRFWKPVEEK